MRGLLRIRSARSPYLRAGLSFPEHAAVEVDIRDLSGARLIELALDPVLSITIGQDDDSFVAMPAIDTSVTAEVAQQMIDNLAKELPERAVSMPMIDSASADLEKAQATIRAQADEIIRHVDRIGVLERKLSEAEIEAGKVIGDRDTEIAALKAKLDDAKAALASAKPKTPAKPRAATDKAGQAD